MSDISKHFVTLGIWSKGDLNFIQRLSKIRNGIAHKNELIISKVLNNGKETHYLNIESLADNHESVDYILQSVKLLVKLIEYSIDQKKK